MHTPYVYLVIQRSPEQRLEVEALQSPAPERLNNLAKGGFVYAHWLLRLREGKNRFRVGGRPLTIVYRRRGGKGRLRFHLRRRERPCLTCHRIDPQRPRDSCRQCHRRLLGGRRWLHGPVGRWACLDCHRKAYDRTGHRFGVLFRGERLCFWCHASKRRWLAQRYVHGPLGAGDCLACHEPHAAAHRGLVRAEGTMGLCLHCHRQKGEELGRPDWRSHGIISGRGCLPCHDPHASAWPHQLRLPPNRLCVGCHPALAKVRRGHPVAGHPVGGPRDPLRPQHRFSCASCHDPHGSPYPKLLIAPNGTPLCSRCHRY